MRNAQHDGPDALRITTQFRVRDGMAYELREHGARLTVLITRSGLHAAWNCEAYTEPGSAIAKDADTRANALRMTAHEWTASAIARPRFDWEGVARLLATVRAI